MSSRELGYFITKNPLAAKSSKYIRRKKRATGVRLHHSARAAAYVNEQPTAGAQAAFDAFQSLGEP
jgi:hypothetical protein